MLEAYTTLGFLAAHTSRARLGTLVTGVHYRHPGMLVKQVTTLDVLSAKGAPGWASARAGTSANRKAWACHFRRSGSASNAWRRRSRSPTRCGAATPQPYYGKHFQLAEPMNSPPAISQPHPPILIGGGGERKTLRLVARYADACNLFARYGRSATWCASWTSCASIARKKVARTTRSPKPRSPSGTQPASQPRRSSINWASCASIGFDTVIASLTRRRDAEANRDPRPRRLSAGRHVSSAYNPRSVRRRQALTLSLSVWAWGR